MSETRQQEKFQEPVGDAPAGTMVLRRAESTYERFMKAQGIPIYPAAGFHNVRELKLGDWKRIGGRGAFLILDNTVDLLGMQVIEIPPGEALNPQRHLYEEKYWVIEGRGSTELWLSDETQRRRFEWTAGSLFAIPMNCSFRLVNASRSPTLLLAGNTAPYMINLFKSEEFVFRNGFEFRDRYDGAPDFFDWNRETLATPDLERAMWQTSLIPDIARCELPLDNQRSPGYRRTELHMANGHFECFVGEHVSGRYSKAHAHSSGAVLICVRGAGYTYNWPVSAGTTPWADGHGGRVETVEYVPGGMVAAAPGGGNWYHQHFGVAREPLRVLVFRSGLPGRRWTEYSGRPGQPVGWLNANLEDGGKSIGYHAEDPYIRGEYKRRLAEHGVEFQMPDSAYRPRR
jgi:mannose-6-phosphate isomerase-like protein (cupin superfamily)